MIITGPHGIDEDKVTTTKDRIWVQCENQQSTAITKGQLLIWDNTDNTSALGQNTRGLRVLVSPASAALQPLAAYAGFAYENVVGTAPTTTMARGKTFLVQTYGFMSGAQTDTNNGYTISLRGMVMQSTVVGANGKISGPVSGGSPSISGGLEVMKMVGFAFQSVGANETISIDIFIKNCM